jgi:outer membrane cobalamin receptor
LQAQELSEREFLSEFPMVLSASRLRQNVMDAPQSVTLIDQDTIRASGVREIPELFRMVPGFNVGYSTHIKGLQPIVSYHGLGGEFFSRLQVLIDGRSMNNATLGGVDWNDFPLCAGRYRACRGRAWSEQRIARHRRLPGNDQLHHQASVATARRVRERQRRQ